MKGSRYRSWGGYPEVTQAAAMMPWRDDTLPPGLGNDVTFLPFGNGRSYGDVCLNSQGIALDCRGLDHFIEFDHQQGLLSCEAGVLLSEILELVVPQGWFLSATPGTQYATVGGAIANDVHGKNHHRAGTFGCHVKEFVLLRSDGQRLRCSEEEHGDLFRATIGGLGLTGVITRATLRLRRIHGPAIDQEVVKFGNVDEFFTLAEESDGQFEHTVAWVDCVARGKKLGRGLFTRGNHAETEPGEPVPGSPAPKNVPVDLPFALVNGLTLRVFNVVYYGMQRRKLRAGRVHYEKFFYPLDSISNWNRIYGKRGFLQYQSAIPHAAAREATRTMLERISASGTGSFLAVLKMFGDKESPGLLSFPLPGATLALDFPNKGRATFRLLEDLDDITREAGGRINPSKDARMSADDFQRGFPAFREMQGFMDPRISSDFWRRVTGRAR